MIIKVDVNVTAPELVESINRLAEVLPGLSRIKEIQEDKSEARTTEPEVKGEKKPSKGKNASKEPAEVKETSDAKEPEVKKLTLEEVKAKLADLSLEGKQAQVKALITEYGVKKLSDIPAEKYDELLKKAEVL